MSNYQFKSSTKKTKSHPYPTATRLKLLNEVVSVGGTRKVAIGFIQGRRIMDLEKGKKWGWLQCLPVPVVTQEDGPIVMAVSDNPSNSLVHSPGCLLLVPFLPRKALGRKEFWSLGSLVPKVPSLPSPVVSHLASNSTLAFHLIQELHLEDNTGIHAWGIWEARDNYTTTIHV